MDQIGVGFSWGSLPTGDILQFCGCCTNVCRNVGSPGPESIPLASEWQQCFYFGRPASFQPPAQGKNMHTQSTLLPRAPLSHPTSPADTILQRPPKPNTANWEVMTARGLLDLIANFSILASHSPSTGKMRLCTSFQKCTSFYFIPFPAFSTVHTHTHPHTSPFSLLGCPEAKNQLEIELHVFSKKLANNFKGQHVCSLFPLARTGLQTAIVDGSLEITATQLTWGEQLFPQAGLQLPHAFYARA